MFGQLLLNGVFTFIGVYCYSVYTRLSKEPWKFMRFSHFETEDSLKEKQDDLPDKMQEHLNIFDMLPENYKNKIYYVTIYLDEQELKLCYLVNTYFDTDYIHDLTESDSFDVNEHGDILYTGKEQESLEYWKEDNLFSICVKVI